MKRVVIVSIVIASFMFGNVVHADDDNADSCEVHSTAFVGAPTLPYGIAGGSTAGWSGLNKYEPDKRALTFGYDTLKPDMKLWLGTFEYLVVVDPHTRHLVCQQIKERLKTKGK